MKLSVFFVSALIATALSLSANAAPIPAVNLTGTTYAFTSPVVAGQTGDITTTKKNLTGGDKEYGYAEGKLAANTEIIFTYTLGSAAGSLISNSFNIPGASHIQATSNGLPSVTTPNLLVTVTANLSGKTGTTTIKNLSSSAVDFFTYLLGRGSNSATAHYTALSTVPLPSAVVLFGSALLVLAGFGYRRRSNQI